MLAMVTREAKESATKTKAKIDKLNGRNTYFGVNSRKNSI